MFINEAKMVLEYAIVNKVPVLLRGGAGIGKSSLIHEITQENNIEIRDIRLPLLDATDLRGLPSIDVVNNIAKWLPPDFLPTDPDSQGLLFLDEITSAAPAVQVAAFQLVLDRKVGNYTLPDGWAIVAGGNRLSDKSYVFKMPKPLANRFIHINLEADVKEWKKWAYKKEIHPSIIGFLTFKEEYLYKDPKEEDAFPTPRTWSYVNEVIEWELPSHAERETLVGTIGEAAAVEFIAYRSVVDKIPDIEKIYEGEDYTLPEDISVLYTINSTLTYRYKKFNKANPFNEKHVLAALMYIDKISSIEMKAATIREFTSNAKVPFIGSKSEAVVRKWREVSAPVKEFLHIEM